MGAIGVPNLLLIIHGYEFATQRTPVFLRSALSARTTPLHIHVFCDSGGCLGFRQAWRKHVLAEGLDYSGDIVSVIEETDDDSASTNMPSESLQLLPGERRSSMPAHARAYLDGLHPRCRARGYDYLFLKLYSAELLPEVDRLIVLDPDAIVLGDLAELWAEFDEFDERHVLSMAVDQSDRYYYRLQNPKDEVYSPGWAGVPHRVGVNGGVLLLHTSRARRVTFAAALSALTHVGAAERDRGRLDVFCDLAEQDALNFAIARYPYIWRPLHCAWNYMDTSRGGHRMTPDQQHTVNFYDTCDEEGLSGAAAERPGDLLRCPCDRKIGILHFVGGVRTRPLLAQLNSTLLSMNGASLRELARSRASRPSWHPSTADDAPDAERHEATDGWQVHGNEL